MTGTICLESQLCHLLCEPSMLTPLGRPPLSSCCPKLYCLLALPHDFKAGQSLSTSLTLKIWWLLITGIGPAHLFSLAANSILLVMTTKTVSKYCEMFPKSSWTEDHWCRYPALSISCVSGEVKEYLL